MKKTKAQLTEAKEKVIHDVFYEPSGHGSIKVTYQDAHEKDPSITYQNVQDWFNKHRNQKTKLTGYNSYVAEGPKVGYQTDLFFITDLGKNQKFTIGLLTIDIFTKKMVVVPLASKEVGDVLAGIMESCQKLGGYPKTLMSDEEPAIYSQGVIDFLKKQGCRLITTRGHAAFAERGIRTFKHMLYERIESSTAEEPQWIDFIDQILVTYNYKLKHSATKLTPAEAEKEPNQLKAKVNMELRAKRKRRYPEISVGSKVRIYAKRKQFDKERVSIWSDEVHEVEGIESYLGQKYYKLKDIKRLYGRWELLKV